MPNRLMPNRLANETSPYLLQHQHNPVDWYPWAPEALERARQEQKPIFLSVGYSACHWCHVMEHESFENQEIADLINSNFVAIKVDREERPDIDQVYMAAVQAMTNHGGWPMSVFLTPELKPFYGGTYFPPFERDGMPGFSQVLAAVSDAWKNRREQALEQSETLTMHLRSLGNEPLDGQRVTVDLLRNAAANLERVFDFTHGGFGRNPKFPHAMDLEVLARVWRRIPRQAYLDMIRLTLAKMARGGIYDHLGGGFARYSVDERWLVPHFEKMLYDNALLANAYLDGFLVTQSAEFAEVARGTLNYLLSDMTDPSGAFHSTEDADSEGVEGKFYVWTAAEIQTILGPELNDRFCYVYDVTAEGNFEHQTNILNLPKSLEQCAAVRGWSLPELLADMRRARQSLFAARKLRVRPGKDDKVLTSWNGLAIHSLARAAGILDEPEYLRAATRAAEFICGTLQKSPGRLWHSWRGGVSKFDGFLDDYANVCQALITLYEVGFEEKWITEATLLAETMLAHFQDHERGGFFFTADDQESLITRGKEFPDGSTPSGNAMAATALLRLAALTGRQDFRNAAERTITAASAFLARSPTAAGQMLIAADLLVGPLTQVVVIGPAESGTGVTARSLHKHFVPNRVLACRESTGPRSRALDPLFEGKFAATELTAFICQDFTCQAPLVGSSAIGKAWQQLEHSGPQ